MEIKSLRNRFVSITTAAMVTVTACAMPTVFSSSAMAATAPPVLSATAAARFLDQTSFGPTAASIAHVQQIGFQASLAEQFQQPTTRFSIPASAQECYPNTIGCTQSQFLNVAVFGNDQLRQRVAMALSELWVAPIHNNGALPFYLNMLANDAFTNYRTIMEDVTLSPQMGAYLDMWNSGKPAAGQIANENYGREMMQLFTIGLDLLNPDGTYQTDSLGNLIPAYSELQVQAFARAYTGWTDANVNGSTPSVFNVVANWNHAMVPVNARHDTSAKILLNGVTLPAGQSAQQDLEGALDNIFAHPNVGPFVCQQLIQHLITGNPSPAYVQRVAAVFDDNGAGVRGDMKAVLTAIFLDPEARDGDVQSPDQADTTPAINGGHLREPLLWTMNVIRGLNPTLVNPQDPYPFTVFMTQTLNAMGEVPFQQVSVFNYFSPQYVIPGTSINSPEFELENTGTVIPRLTIADYIIHNKVKGLNIDLSPSSAIGSLAGNPPALADYLGMLFMHGQMTSEMRSELITSVANIPASNPLERSQLAVYFVVTSTPYKINH